MNKLYSILSCMFLVALLLIGAYSLLDQDATYSRHEKRSLKTKPSATISTLLDGSYAKDFQSYYADTFPQRESLLRLNRTLNGFYYFSAFSAKDSAQLAVNFQSGAANRGEALANHQTEPPTDSLKDAVEPTTEATQAPTEPEAAVESLGTVLLVGNRAMDVPYADYSCIERYAETVTAIASALGDGVRTFHMAVPNSAEFYTPEEYHTGDRSQKNMIAYDYGKVGNQVTTVDVYSQLAAHTDEYLYFRTDHHWTQLGSYYAYKAFCEAAGFAAEPLEKFEKGQYDDFVGSMYTYISDYPQSQILQDEPDTLYFYRPFVEAKARYYSDATLSDPAAIGVISHIEESVTNKYLCFIGGDTPVCVVKTGVEGPVCMILKDSYGNAFVPWLTSHYSKIIAVDPREFNRTGMPELDLAAFAREQGVDDCIILNYPMMWNSEAYVDWLGRLVAEHTD